MSLFERFNLGHGFKKYFEVVPATNDALRQAVFRIRHEVYCEDLKFEPERADRMETDRYDRHSLHCLIRSSQEPHALVGCTRLVLADPGDPTAPLPFELTCQETIDRKLIDPSKMPRNRIAEVSRLAVRAAYRRRKGELHDAVTINNEDFGKSGHPRFPYIPIGLYLGAVALASRSGIDTLFVLTEPRLAAHFGKIGVDIKQIGAPVQHRGTRIPSVMDVASIIRDMRFILKPIWHAVQAQIDRGFETSAEGQNHDG